MKKTLFIIDAYNLIYRMFYAIPEMHTRDGRQVNAIFGVAKFLRQLAEENPDAEVVVASDVGKSFRADMYGEYKAQRDRMPDNLRSQIEGVFSLFATAGIQILSQEGYEADDIIGSLCSQGKVKSQKGEVWEQDNAEQDFSASLEMTQPKNPKVQESNSQMIIISSDKDLCQFVEDGRVHIYDAMKRKFMKRSDVIEKFGVPPEQVRDYLAIVGDSSDNIPGITGFGPKKAVDLLTKYGTLEGVYEHLEDLTPKMQEVLIAQQENALLSQKLATIVRDLVVDIPEDSVLASGLQSASYIDLLRAYEFRSLMPATQAIESVPKRDIATEEIKTLDQLDALMDRVHSGKLPLSLSTDAFGRIFCGVEGVVYSIDTRKIDASGLVEFLLDEERQIVGYGVKSDLKRLYELKKPAEVAGNEGQGRLF